MSRPHRTPRPARRAAGPLLVTAALAVLAACGGTGGSSASGATTASTTAGTSTSGSGSSSSGAGSTEQTRSVTVTAADFEFRMDSTDLPAGTYEITLSNDGSATHDLVVERDGADVAQSKRIGPGDSSTFTVTLEPGTYVFYCSIGNHRAMGMETEVTVS